LVEKATITKRIGKSNDSWLKLCRFVHEYSYEEDEEDKKLITSTADKLNFKNEEKRESKLDYQSIEDRRILHARQKKKVGEKMQNRSNKSM
jgi:hypothetical protein